MSKNAKGNVSTDHTVDIVREWYVHASDKQRDLIWMRANRLLREEHPDDQMVGRLAKLGLAFLQIQFDAASRGVCPTPGIPLQESLGETIVPSETPKVRSTTETSTTVV